MNGGLRSRSPRMLRAPEEPNPLEGMVNVADAMLVFACGLMLALAVYWNIDLGPIGAHIELERGEELTEVSDLREDLIESESRGELFEKMGTVYKDPRTGQLFMLTDHE